MNPALDPQKDKLLEAILPHVAFDGWSETAFRAALEDEGMSAEAGRLVCPRGALDLAVYFHQEGDRQMAEALSNMDLAAMKIRERVAAAVRARLDVIPDKEAVRRGSTLFALPHHAAEGSALIWGTADAIWTALGDPSRDVNWYTKRATLSAVYGSVVLYWLGDDSVGHQATDAFIDRRIENVMQFEKVKAAVRDNPLTKPFAAALGKALSGVRAPSRTPPEDLPGYWAPQDRT